jgi:hypothetical protein
VREQQLLEHAESYVLYETNRDRLHRLLFAIVRRFEALGREDALPQPGPDAIEEALGPGPGRDSDIPF